MSTTDKAPIDASLGSHQVLPRSLACDRWNYQEGFTVYFPRTLLCNPTVFVSRGLARLASTREPPGSHGAPVSPARSLHFPPRAPRPWPLLRGKRSYIAIRVAIHVARTWRGVRRISLIREVRAITTGTLGKRPVRDLHADARVSFLIYTWRPFYLKGAIKPLICGKVTP